MDAEELDARVREAAPATTTPTAELDGHLRALVLETQEAARPPRRARRLGVVVAVSTAVVGLGAAAAVAAGLTAVNVPWSTHAGSRCQMEFSVVSSGSDGEPLSRHYSPSERQHALAEASSFLSAFDYRSIDEAAAVRQWKADEDRVIAAQPDPAERQPRLSGDDLELTAVGAQVWSHLNAHLRAEGIAPELVVSIQSMRCGR